MKENLFGAGLALSVLFLVVTFPATGNAEEQKEVLYASPSGGLRIERNGQKATTKYTGTLKDDTITGKAERDGQDAREWVAKRQK